MDSNINFDELYYIRPKSIRGEFEAQPENYLQLSHDQVIGYPEGKFPNGKPTVFVQTSGSDKKKPYPIIPSTMGLLLFHNQIIKIFQEKNFTGWDSYPIMIHRKNGEVIEDYHVFINIGICGHYDVSKSKVIDYTADNGGFILREKRYQGMYFDPKTWDGSDIFMMENTWITIVTEPVMLELKRLKANLNMTKLSEYLLFDKVE